MREAEAVLMAQPLFSKRTLIDEPSGLRETSTLMASPQLGFSSMADSGMWSSLAAPRGER
jgi:hypothetical protein